MAKKVFICSPYRGDIARNTELARYVGHIALACGYIPIIPHLLYPTMLNDKKPDERVREIKIGAQLLEDCDVLWLIGGKVTTGMRYILDHAIFKGIPVELHDAECNHINPDTLSIDDRVTDEVREAVRGAKLV